MGATSFHGGWAAPVAVGPRYGTRLPIKSHRRPQPWLACVILSARRHRLLECCMTYVPAMLLYAALLCLTQTILLWHSIYLLA